MLEITPFTTVIVLLSAEVNDPEAPVTEGPVGPVGPVGPMLLELDSTQNPS
jgi:hypothetical protein